MKIRKLLKELKEGNIDAEAGPVKGNTNIKFVTVNNNGSKIAEYEYNVFNKKLSTVFEDPKFIAAIKNYSTMIKPKIMAILQNAKFNSIENNNPDLIFNYVNGVLDYKGKTIPD